MATRRRHGLHAQQGPVAVDLDIAKDRDRLSELFQNEGRIAEKMERLRVPQQGLAASLQPVEQGRDQQKEHYKWHPG